MAAECVFGPSEFVRLVKFYNLIFEYSINRTLNNVFKFLYFHSLYSII